MARARAWTRHAEGVLSSTSRCHPQRGLRANGLRRVRNWLTFPRLTRSWPRVDTNTVRHSAACARCGAGAPRCLPEAALPEKAKADASRFDLHPVLLDAVLHSIVVGGILAESELTRLPFEWEGLSLHAIGASRLRARITLVGDDTVAVTLMDSCGVLIGRIDSLALRGVSPSRLLMSTVADEGLYGLDWVALAPM